MVPPEGVNVTKPNSARMYDFLLGGSHNFEVDRRAAEDMQQIFPDAAFYARSNRAFLGRVVRYLIDAGIEQFLDLGSGIPTVGNVHEIALERRPGARVAYVDHEPVAVRHARHVIGDDEDRVTITEADIRRPDEVLDAPGVRDLLDFSRPVAVLAVGVLPFVPGDEAAAVMAQYRDRTAPGSYAAVSHLSRIGMTEEQMAAGLEIMRRTPTPEQPRTPEEVRDLLPGYTIVEPGVVPVPQWRPDREPTEDEISRSNCYGAVGHRA
ncbi:hypothetical protein F1721_21940 [Saccharopolyspora hirsuta]|uniref:SAM-dependent methyltransferase n=2 Tax=Saccharopolyspora hirsuta TaxID=1837 RepID=A0A5M7BLP4_SACHI|nr:hypothetical protein F1721_21940 [Saccharopolyspora hirsuta]